MPRGLRCKPRRLATGFISDKNATAAYTRRTGLISSVATAAQWQTRHHQDRVTGASARAAVHLPAQNNLQGLFILAGNCLPFIFRALRPAIASGHCSVVLIFHLPRDRPADF